MSWPQELPKKIRLANFRERGVKERHRSTFRTERSGMSDLHCERLRLMPCCVTLIQPAGTVHHLKSGEAAKFRGVGLRAPDRFGLPMSLDAHMELERIGSRHEQQWFRDRGVEPFELACSLWESSGDLEKMVKILIAHREHFGEHD